MGKKKQPDPSLKGKKPMNVGKISKNKKTAITRNPSHIRNKLKRSEVYGKFLQDRKAQKKQERLERDKQAEQLGDENAAFAKQIPNTLERTRQAEPTMVNVDHDSTTEVVEDEADDEFAPYFSNVTAPKILITTRPKPSQQLFYFIADLQTFIPHAYFYPRKHYSIKEICSFGISRNFTHLIVLSEKSKRVHGMTISHLGPTTTNDANNDNSSVGGGGGPTAFFKISNVVTSQNIPHHGVSTRHVPELNMHGFGTRLGHRVGRFLASLFPHDAEFQGRQVATFHNQRDYIFVRQHRYVFEESKQVKPNNNPDNNTTNNQNTKTTKARLQELGPRFTLKLQWLQEGTFDTQFGEYEWYHKRKEMDTTRRRFHL